MADLEALVKSQGWQEILDHASEVRPASRNDRWLAITSEAAQKRLASLPVDKQPLQALGFCIASVRDYPHLKKSRPFMELRAKVGLKAFPACFELDVGERCDGLFFEFVQADPSNRDLAFEAGKLVRRRVANLAAVPYFALALQGAAATERCKDADVALAVIAGLNAPAQRAEVAPAKQLAFGACFPALRKPLSEEVMQQREDYLKNACPGLLAKKALDGLRLRKCEVRR
jgi:hypothetical protein